MKGNPSQTPTAQYQAGLQCGRPESKTGEGIVFLSLVGRQENAVCSLRLLLLTASGGEGLSDFTQQQPLTAGEGWSLSF